MWKRDRKLGRSECWLFCPSQDCKAGQALRELVDIAHRGVPIGAVRRLRVAPGAGELEALLEGGTGIHDPSLLERGPAHISLAPYSGPGPWGADWA